MNHITYTQLAINAGWLTLGFILWEIAKRVIKMNGLSTRKIQGRVERGDTVLCLQRIKDTNIAAVVQGIFLFEDDDNDGIDEGVSCQPYNCRVRLDNGEEIWVNRRMMKKRD